MLALLIIEKSVARDASNSEIRKLRGRRLHRLIRIRLLLATNIKDRKLDLLDVYSNCLE